MGKKKKPPSLIVQLFQPDADTRRWISYDIPELKIEVMHIEKVWIAAGTLDDEYNYFYGRELSETAPERIVALTALLSQTGLPMMLGMTDDFGSSIYDFYPDIEFQWQNKRTGQFDSELILPRRNKLDITFHQRSDGSWIWQNRFCKIEVLLIGSTWIATCDPRSSGTETVERPRLMVESQDRDAAVNLLLKDKNIAAAFGLCYGQQVSLNELFDVIKINWNQPTQRIVAKKRERPQQKPLSHNRCSWASVAQQCDGTFNCFFCASYGEAYVIRWDD